MTPDRETEYSRLLRDYWRRDGALVYGAHLGRADMSRTDVETLVERQEQLDKVFNEQCLERRFTDAARLEHGLRLYAASERHFGTSAGMVEAHRRRAKAAKQNDDSATFH